MNTQHWPPRLRIRFRYAAQLAAARVRQTRSGLGIYIRLSLNMFILAMLAGVCGAAETATKTPVSVILAAEGTARLPIVVSDGAGPATLTAAEDLARCLKIMTGAVFETQTVPVGASRGTGSRRSASSPTRPEKTFSLSTTSVNRPSPTVRICWTNWGFLISTGKSARLTEPSSCLPTRRSLSPQRAVSHHKGASEAEAP